MLNWMECVRNRKTPNANIEAGYGHSVALCMTIAAIQSGQRATFDDDKQEVMVAMPSGSRMNNPFVTLAKAWLYL